MNENLRKGSSIFFIELEKIEPNPYQPRIEFNEEKLNALAESIKQYGVLQPIVVSRQEEYSEEFGIKTKYQIIAGERRFRASKIAGLTQIPAIIREGEQSDAEKLELAIIENLQREDLNPVDKATAFKKLSDEFKLTHAEIAKKMGKSREYVSNAMRILMLPANMLAGLTSGKMTEGHTRSLLMLKDRPQEQEELYKRILNDRLTVRAAEKIARNVAVDKIRKKIDLDPEIKAIEKEIKDKLGTRVTIDQKPIGDGGRLTIEYFSKDDLKQILAVIEGREEIVSSSKERVEDSVLAQEISLIKEHEIKDRIEVAEESINNFPGISDRLNEKLETIDTKPVDDIGGLEKVNIKNDFDKSRIDSLRKSDDILKNLNSVINIASPASDVDDWSLNRERKIDLKDTNNKDFLAEHNDGDITTDIIDTVTVDTPTDNSNPYSDLYSQFLKSKDDSKDEIHKHESEDKKITMNDESLVVKTADSVDTTLNEFKQNLLGDQAEIVNTGTRVNTINSVSTDDFLADVNQKKEEEKKEEERDDDDLKPDNIYSFKGFSL